VENQSEGERAKGRKSQGAKEPGGEPAKGRKSQTPSGFTDTQEWADRTFYIQKPASDFQLQKIAMSRVSTVP